MSELATGTPGVGDEPIITVRVKDIEAWLVEAFEAGMVGSTATVSWRLTDVGWKPTLHAEARP